jgi:hypothetical protein
VGRPRFSRASSCCRFARPSPPVPPDPGPLYCYALTRADLPPVHQAVQAAHACIEAARTGLIPSHIPHPHLIVCAVADEAALRAWVERLDRRGIRHAAFREPDREGELTALCTGPVRGACRSVFRKLPLLTFSKAMPAPAAAVERPPPGGAG